MDEEALLQVGQGLTALEQKQIPVDGLFDLATNAQKLDSPLNRPSLADDDMVENESVSAVSESSSVAKKTSPSEHLDRFVA